MKSLSADMRLELFPDSVHFYESAKAISMPFVSLPASHVYGNMLAACTVARACGMEWREIEPALFQLELPQGRLQCIDNKGITFINDAYNAAAASLQAALTVLKEKGGSRRKVAVIGAMRELGTHSQDAHKAVGQWALDCADVMVCLGKDCSPIVETWNAVGRDVFWFLEFEEVAAFLKQFLSSGDVVLLKGKNPDKLSRIINEI